jgi:hypothetical protein
MKYAQKYLFKVLEYMVKHQNNRIYQTPVFSVCCVGVIYLKASSCISKSQVQSPAPYIDTTMSEVTRCMESSFIQSSDLLLFLHAMNPLMSY